MTTSSDSQDRKIAARTALFRKGVIAAWYLKPYQYDLYNLISRTIRDIIVPNITRRFGKSSVCVCYSIEQAIRKKQNIRYATAFLTDLENFIEPIFENIMEDIPERFRPRWAPGKKTWVFQNGSKIKLVGIDKNPNGIRGNAIDILIIDEAAFVQKLEYLYKSIIVPATARRKFKLVFPSTPPESPEHFWAKELIPKAISRNTYIELTMDHVDDISKDEKQRLFDEVGGKDSITARREFFCKIIADESRAIAPNFNPERHIGHHLTDDRYIKWIYVGDTGGLLDKTVILKVGYCHELKKVVIAEELAFDSNVTTPRIVQAFIQWAGTSNLTMDAPGQTKVDMAELGLNIGTPIKDEFTSSIRYLNSELYNNQFLIAENCKLLITTLKAGLLTVNKKDYTRTEELGHCDAAAALIYALRVVDRIQDLRPVKKYSKMYDVSQESRKPSNIGGLFA